MLKANDIQVHYGRKCVLQQVSLEANPGECIGILGTNGCGKSTLLKILAGVLSPTKGTVFYNGHDACKNPRIFMEYAGYVPQDNPLMEDLTVYDNLKLWYTNSKSDVTAELEQGTLHMLELHTVLNKKVRTLSGGMKKRLSIGCALANQPSVLILDEPTTSLDLPCKEDIRIYLKRYLQYEGTVIITTHEEPDLDVCTRLLMLENGFLKSIPADTRGTQLSHLLKQNKKEG